MEEAEWLADRILVIDTGDVIADGTASELKDRLGGDLLEARSRSRPPRANGVGTHRPR
jgi:ABC-2 type transport system ATP-binding protein